MDESVISDAVDAKVKAKDFEISFMLLGQACSLYSHVKRYGIDRTFLSIYNSNGELDRLCGIQFPSCEVFSTEGDRYGRYTTAFLVAMEGSKISLWQRIKDKIKDFWDWIVGGLARMILKLYRKLALWSTNIDRLVKSIESKYDMSQTVRLPKKFLIAWMAENSAIDKSNMLSEMLNNIKMKANCGKDLVKNLNELADIVKTAANTKESSADVADRLLKVDEDIKQNSDMITTYTNKKVEAYKPENDVETNLRTLLNGITNFSSFIKMTLEEHDALYDDAKSVVKKLKDAIYTLADADESYYANDDSLPQRLLKGISYANSLLNMDFSDNMFVVRLASFIYEELYEVSRTLASKA